MNNYIKNLHSDIKEYFKILSPEFPDWLIDYINTPPMQRLNGISMNCGLDYCKLFNIQYWYSTLDHSVAVALIIWHFTHDKKQTLAGLFHDIATPAFKHCIDFLYGDTMVQESTEEKTAIIISNSIEICTLLKKDNIKIEDVINYHIYPIADNNIPRLSADRFEYNFSSGLSFYHIWQLDSIKEIYQNVEILINEDNTIELGFTDLKIAEKYINTISKLWPQWISDKDRTAMQFIADIIKSMLIRGYLTINDLYTLSERKIIEKIVNCQNDYLKNNFIKFQNAISFYGSDLFQKDKYCINIDVKKRYVIPLVKYNNKISRINDISLKAAKEIDQYLNLKHFKYTGFNFNFKPYAYKDLKDYKKL